jgi:hypothetical protein
MKERVRENYIRWGDENLAKRLAAKEMARVWGISNMSGRKVLMKLPPDDPTHNHWPKVGGSHDYVAPQLQADLAKALGKEPDEIDMSRVELRPTLDGRTQRAIVSGREMPAYTVLYADDNGLPMMALPQPWAPDPDKANAERDAKTTADSKEAQDSARTREASRQAIAPYKPDVLLREGAKGLYRWFTEPK